MDLFEERSYINIDKGNKKNGVCVSLWSYVANEAMGPSIHIIYNTASYNAMHEHRGSDDLDANSMTRT
jgi:hypothetical protein